MRQYTIQILENNVTPVAHKSLEPEFKVFTAWNMLRNRCIEKELEFNLTLADIKRMLATKRCYYTGQVLDRTNSHPENKPSFERVDSSKGYVKGNVVVTCMKANHLKANLELKQLKRMVKRIEKHKY